ncbi:hypothetical protein NDU88_000946 [Pleurodeles waltl]|uniref:Uncharacterized protein n=1 Tax=Pleurodeles waltl TaxID=8319 RepID=A0AAV7URF9_PLEWA|nr:hypothetical protein NDU88_000946 [Pleurodeles waltl]
MSRGIYRTLPQVAPSAYRLARVHSKSYNAPLSHYSVPSRLHPTYHAPLCSTTPPARNLLRSTPAPKIRGTAQPDPEVSHQQGLCTTSRASPHQPAKHRALRRSGGKNTSQSSPHRPQHRDSHSKHWAHTQPTPVLPHPLLGLSTSFLRPGFPLRSRAWRPQPVRHSAAGYPNEAGKPLAPRSSRHKRAPVTTFICCPTPGQKRPAHWSAGPALKGGSSPRTRRPASPNVTFTCAWGGAAGAAVRPDRRQPQLLERGIPSGESTHLRPQEAAGSAARQGAPAPEAHALSLAALRSWPSPPIGATLWPALGRGLLQDLTWHRGPTHQLRR